MSYLFAFSLAVAFLDNIRLRYRIHSWKIRDAAMVAAALGPTVDVDGVMLPAHNDAWKPDSNHYDGNKHLKLGRVKVSHDGYIYVGGGIFMEPTHSTKSYCTAVWREYRSRNAQQR